jgi:Trypsin-co-occurring domain 1
MANKQLAEFSLEDGTKFLVEVEEPESKGVERVALPWGQKVLKPKQPSFEKVLDEVKPVASTILSKLSDLATPANEVEVKFGLKLMADAGVVFASVGSEFNYEITLKWQTSKSG